MYNKTLKLSLKIILISNKLTFKNKKDGFLGQFIRDYGVNKTLCNQINHHDGLIMNAL